GVVLKGSAHVVKRDYVCPNSVLESIEVVKNGVEPEPNFDQIAVDVIGLGSECALERLRGLFHRVRAASAIRAVLQAFIEIIEQGARRAIVEQIIDHFIRSFRLRLPDIPTVLEKSEADLDDGDRAKKATNDPGQLLIGIRGSAMRSPKVAASDTSQLATAK